MCVIRPRTDRVSIFKIGERTANKRGLLFLKSTFSMLNTFDSVTSGFEALSSTVVFDGYKFEKSGLINRSKSTSKFEDPLIMLMSLNSCLSSS